MGPRCDCIRRVTERRHQRERGRKRRRGTLVNKEGKGDQRGKDMERVAVTQTKQKQDTRVNEERRRRLKREKETSVNRERKPKRWKE